ARAGTISAYQSVDVRINQYSGDGGNSNGLIVGSSFGAPLSSGTGTSYKPPTIQGVLDGIKRPSEPGEGFLGGVLGGPPKPYTFGFPGVSPIPEPRTWVLYAFAAVLGAWVLRKELRAS